jgi:hypothetical protein
LLSRCSEEDYDGRKTLALALEMNSTAGLRPAPRRGRLGLRIACQNGKHQVAQGQVSSPARLGFGARNEFYRPPSPGRPDEDVWAYVSRTKREVSGCVGAGVLPCRAKLSPLYL